MTVAFDDWLRRAWPAGPPNWDRAYLKELYEDDLRRTAKARAASAEGQRLARVERRLAALERALGPELMRGGTLIDTLGAVVARQRQETKRAINDAIDARGLMSDQGIWTEARRYTPGSVVTHKGSAWACRVENSGLRPGDSNAAWRLLHKSGGGS